MKRNNLKSNKGFTLVEMLGVLAIIAILISVIAVGVMSAINRARIVATEANFKNLETAVVGFVALPNSGGTVPFTVEDPDNAGAPIRTYDGAAFAQVANAGDYTLDQVLRASGLIDRPLSWRVGVDGTTQVNLAEERLFILSKNSWSDGVNVNDVPPGTGNDWTNFNHCEVAPFATGVAAALPVIPGASADFRLDGQSSLQAARVAYVVLHNVSIKDAKKLSAELNGSLDATEFNNFQYEGRLIFEAPVAPAQTVNVYYYLASF